MPHRSAQLLRDRSYASMRFWRRWLSLVQSAGAGGQSCPRGSTCTSNAHRRTTATAACKALETRIRTAPRGCRQSPSGRGQRRGRPCLILLPLGPIFFWRMAHRRSGERRPSLGEESEARCSPNGYATMLVRRGWRADDGRGAVLRGRSDTGVIAAPTALASYGRDSKSVPISTSAAPSRCGAFVGLRCTWMRSCHWTVLGREGSSSSIHAMVCARLPCLHGSFGAGRCGRQRGVFPAMTH